MTRLVVILGDQLSPQISSLQAAQKDEDWVLMAEVWDETHYVRHHKQKIAFIFAAMRHFADELRESGWQVHYHTYTPDSSLHTIGDVVGEFLAHHPCEQVVITRCGEWRLQQQIAQWSAQLGIEVKSPEDDRFVCREAEFQDWASGRKQLRMEYFYRQMRRLTGLLMLDDKPIGGKWNFDAANRKRYDGKQPIPVLPATDPDAITAQVIALVNQHFADNPGQLDRWWLPVTRETAEAWFEAFLDTRLTGFGDYEDAMVQQQPFLFHGLISALLNVGLLDPLACCRAAEARYHQEQAPLNAVEGFIRQIIGWREYVRGIYWLWMPEYAQLNALQADRPLPDFYWSGQTRMRCMAEAIGQTLELGYAHHIQRLMVTGNFALMLGADPKAVCDWYLAIYVDAFEWVELPNTLGMALHGDGGRLASKPYAASGKYIQRMSDYCKGCDYAVTEASSDNACPFNALYWHFMIRHRERLARNPRVGAIYRGFDNKPDEEQAAILSRAEAIIAAPDRY